MRLKIMILLLIGIIALSGIFAMTQSHAVLAMAEGSLAGELTKALGNDASVADVEIASIHSVVLHGVNLYDKQNRLAVAAPTIEVSFSLMDIIRGKNAVEAIKEIGISNPRIELFQTTDGRWNVEDLFNRQDKAENVFGAKVKVVGASVAVNTPQGSWQADAVSGILDFVHKPWISVKLSGKYQGTPISAAGKVNSSLDGVLTAKAAQVGLNSIAGLLPQSKDLQIIDGSFKDIEITLQKDKDKLSWAGETTVEAVSANAGNFRIRDGKGLLTFTEKQLYFFSSAAKLNDQPVEIRGKVSINTSEPIFDVNVKSPGFDPASFWSESPLRGLVVVDADVKGTLARPLIKAKLKMDKGELNGQTVADALANVKLTGSLLDVNELKADLFGGQLQASGTVDISSQQFKLQVQGRNVDSSVAGLLPGLAGAVSFDAAIAGQGSLQNADIRGTAALADGNWRGISFRDASVGFDKIASEISLSYLSANVGEGSLVGHGSVNGDALNIKLVGHNVPLKELNKLADGIAFDGLVSFEGSLLGTTDKPELSAQFRAEKGQALNQPFQEASGNLRIDSMNISLSDVELIDGNAKHTVQGTIGLSKAGSLDLMVTTKQARAENLVKLIAPGERLTGNVDNSVAITGKIDNLTVSGRFKLTEGSFRGYLIASGEGAYERVNGVTIIRDVVLNSLNARISLAGTIGADNEMNLDLAAKDVDLARLHVSYPYPVQGLANFSGQLTGTASNINFSGNLTASNVSLNGQKIDNINASVMIAGDEISIPMFSFAQGQGRYSFSGGINTAAERIYGGVDVENGELAPLLTILNIPAKDIGGRLNGHIAVNGLLKKPNIWLTGNLAAGKLKNYPLDNIDIDVSLENNIVTVNQFLAKQGTGILAIRGTADLDGPLNLEVGGRDLDAGLLTVWFDSTIDTKGKLDFAAQVAGTAQNPHAAVSLEIKGGGVSNATFDNLYGLFVIDKGSIHVNQLLLTKGVHRASAYGLIPLATLNREGRKNATIADQMNLHIRLDQADLSILPLLTKEVSWANGRTEGELLISGTLMQPNVQGSIRIPNGVIKLKSLVDPIQKVAVDIQFEGDKINIKSFDGASGGGGSYRLAGSASVKGMNLEDYQLLLSMDRFKINHKYFKGPLTGTLTLAQAGAIPKLSGKLVFENDEINIPFIPEVTATDVNVGLDLELQVGNRVRFHNPYMYDIIASGRVKMSGTTQQPAVSGRIEANRGTVSYLRTEFKIKEGRADFTQFGSFEPLITLNADTRLERTTVNLRVNGPVSAMEFKLTSEPAMSQQEILSLLTLRSRYFDRQNSGNVGRDSGLSRDEVIGILDAGLQMRFVTEMEDAFRRAFGLDGFKLVKGTLSDDTTSNNSSKTTSSSSAKQVQETSSDREVYNVEVSKYVTDRLMLSYTFGVDHKEYTAAFRYDITKRISLTGSVDEYNRRRFGIETRFSF